MTSLEIADLEQIVRTVRCESQRLRGGRKRLGIGPSQRAAFLLLRLVAFSIPIALALLLLGILLLGWGGSLQALLLLLWLIVVAPVLVVLLSLLNLPLVVMAWKQRRLIVRRGLLVPAFPWWQRRGGWIVIGLTAAAAVLHFTLPAFNRFGGLIVVLLLITVPFSLLVLQSFLRLAESNLDLLREVEELKVVLEQKLAEARRESRDRVDVTHELAVRLADTTTSIHSHQRLEAIGDSMREPRSQYSVSQSRSFRTSLAAFEPSIRLQLLDRVQELAANRHPDDSHHDEASADWHWALSDSEVEIVYEVADETRQVLVRDVRPLRPAGGGETQGAG